MPADMLTISRQRLRQILQEEVTLGNVKRAVTDRLGDSVPRGGVSAEVSGEHHIPGDPKMGTTSKTYDIIEFTALLRPGTTVDQAKQLAIGLRSALEMEDLESTSQDPGVGEFSIDGDFAVSEEDVATTAGIQTRVKIVGRLKDGFPEDAQPLGSGTGPSRPVSPGIAADMDAAIPPSTPGQWSGSAAKVVERTETMWLPRKALTTVMERLEDEEATGAEWWKAMLDDVVEEQAKEIKKDVTIHDWAAFLKGTFNFAKEAIDLVSSNNAKTVTIPSDQVLKDEVQAAYERNDSGVFGDIPTVRSPRVSESLDPLRRIVRQIISESCLSKDA